MAITTILEIPLERRAQPTGAQAMHK